jgi:ferrochelatase
MKTGVVMMNFGEPAEPTLEQVVPFLERIFFQNASLDRSGPEAQRRRARELAEQRAPGLLEEYEEIGGSPLNAQADAQAEAVEEELRARGHDLKVYSAYQYTEPFIADEAARARDDGLERLVALPVYPLCGHSTNVLALQALQDAVAEIEDWEPEILELVGWHGHTDFVPMWADNVTRYLFDEDVDLHADGVELVFSIHGTPLKYLEGGSRYDRYVDEACSGIAELLGVGRYHMGYQNHTNRRIAWTQPDIETVVEGLGGRADRIVVVPVAFMHEQSETLAELDHELAETAEEAGLGFHRVPVPWDDQRLTGILADLVEARLAVKPASGCCADLRRCFCRGGGDARCTNGLRLSSVVEVEGGRREIAEGVPR